MNKKFDAIIVAAGSGKRMNMGINKQLLEIDSKPVLAWSLKEFYNNPSIENIILTIREEDRNEIIRLLEKYKFENIHLVVGGKERQNSIDNALKYLENLLINNINSPNSDKETYTKNIDFSKRYVMIHDGARPFIDIQTIENAMVETITCNCTCVGVPSKDTVKVIDSENKISSTPDRKFIWNAQTPQSFRLDIVLDAYKKAFESNFIGTDDASLVENIGYKVKMIMGSYNNIKITTKEDLDFADIIAKKISAKEM